MLQPIGELFAVRLIFPLTHRATRRLFQADSLYSSGFVGSLERSALARASVVLSSEISFEGHKKLFMDAQAEANKDEPYCTRQMRCPLYRSQRLEVEGLLRG